MRGKRYVILIPFEKAFVLEWLCDLLNDYVDGCWFINPGLCERNLDVIINDLHEQWNDIACAVGAELQKRYGDYNGIVLEETCWVKNS